jgi:deazaflavin-dependent oxidoreductase (nitroreductase family)
VGNGLIRDTFWLLAALGTRADYVRNLKANPMVRVKIGRRWHSGRAVVVSDDESMARLDDIVSHFGRLRRIDARILRKLTDRTGSHPVSIRIDVE